MLDVRPLELEGVVEIRPLRFRDDRGFFSEVWNGSAMEQAGLKLQFVQDNYTHSTARGVLRGLHFQANPQAQDKLVWVSRGSIFDVAVDVRRSSATFGKWVGRILSASQWNQLLIPKGFAHGYVTLEDDTEVQYKVTAFYHPELERAIRFDDPDIGISWPISHDEVQLSARDRHAPLLSAVDTGF